MIKNLFGGSAAGMGNPQSGLINRGMMRAATLAGIKNRGYSALEEFGYPGEVDLEDILWQYRRSGLAKGIVRNLVDLAWSKPPELVDGIEGEEILEETIRKHLAKIRAWRAFEIADLRAVLGGWSLIVMEVNDGKETSEPLENLQGSGGIEAITNLRPLWRTSVDIEEDEFGDIKRITYRPKNGGRQLEIHPSRAIVFSETGERDKDLSVIGNVFNALVAAQKIEMASAVSVETNSLNPLYLEVGSDVDTRAIGSTKTDPEDVGKDFGELMIQAVSALRNRSIPGVALQNVKVHQLQTQLRDTSPHYNLCIREIAAGTGISSRRLTGSETGERSSTEDRNNDLANIESRRARVINPVLQEFIDRLISAGALPDGGDREWQPRWEPLSEVRSKSDAEKAKILAETNALTKRDTGLVPFDPDEIRDAADYEPLTDEQRNEAAGYEPGLSDPLEIPPSEGGGRINRTPEDQA